MRTLVKYRGGKSREISEFRRFIPEHYDRYIEPFFGGGAVFFELEPERAIINDVNEKLMNFYTEVRDNYAQLTAELEELQLIYEENQAIYAREKVLHPDDRVDNMNEEYIANDKTDKDDISYSLYGTNSFNLVWEKVCAENFGSVLDTAIVDLPLYKEKTNKTETKETTLRDVIKAPRWRKSEYTMVKDPKVETLKPDLVCIYPVDDEQKDYCFGIYDAKYYCIDYQVKDNKAKISGQPGVGDVTKQYLYQLAFDDFIVKQGYRYVQNMFFCPGETADRDFGWVQMDMLHQIGDKKLENIAVVKLCASEMYDIYLENKTIDEREIGKYIPVVGIQEVESQNFAKRMLAYLTRITNASKMAEKKLEMKAERGNLIYPKQIKRELGAKIIYDAICPVASKAFYGFDPYEKETYGGMVAEDIGDSYVRCGQIADAAIEIEKIIKDLSEQELQDEKVVKVILKKCFENKEDIGSMAEGMCLEMLTEKVMELVRDLYL